MTRFPIFGTYYICLSHHVLTWNYSSSVSCISHLWWDTFKLVVWYWFASWIWFLACIASSLMNATYDETVLTWQSDIDCTFHMVSCSVSNLLKCLLFSYHIIGVNMSSHPFFVHIPSSYHDFAFHQSSVRQYHAWMSLKSELYSFFLSVWPHNAKSIKLKEIGKALDDGGPSEQLKWRFSTDSTPPSSQQDSQDNARLDSQRSCVDDEHISPSPPSQVLALTSQCDMWLHVAYGV